MAAVAPWETTGRGLKLICEPIIFLGIGCSEIVLDLKRLALEL